MIPLPQWMRLTLYVTAVMNIAVSAAFIPGATALRAMAGLPQASHPLYISTVGVFVMLFGIGYLWAATVGRADRLFIALATVGKLSFFALLVRLWIAGALPLRAPLLGTADLIFGSLFLIWLLRTRADALAASELFRRAS